MDYFPCPPHTLINPWGFFAQYIVCKISILNPGVTTLLVFLLLHVVNT